MEFTKSELFKDLTQFIDSGFEEKKVYGEDKYVLISIPCDEYIITIYEDIDPYEVISKAIQHLPMHEVYKLYFPDTITIGFNKNITIKSEMIGINLVVEGYAYSAYNIFETEEEAKEYLGEDLFDDVCELDDYTFAVPKNMLYDIVETYLTNLDKYKDCDKVYDKDGYETDLSEMLDEEISKYLRKYKSTFNTFTKEEMKSIEGIIYE